MSVYLKGAKDATQKFAALYKVKRDTQARADFEDFLDELEENFTAKLTAIGLGLTLAGCAPFLSTTINDRIVPGTPIQTVPTTAPSIDIPAVAPSPALSAYYARQEKSLTARGFMRRDFAPEDAPISAIKLAQNFERIAMFREHARDSNNNINSNVEGVLNRWQAPIKAQLHFGGSTSQRERKTFERQSKEVLSAIKMATNHPISMGGNGNLHVFLVSEGERQGLGDILRDLVPGIHDLDVQLITHLGRQNLCVMMAFPDSHDQNSFGNALVLIRSELSQAMRYACLHEELAQAMGLGNDHRLARPSVFNDDDEFIYLTQHDLYLLQMLYDPRLKPGMTIETARPIYGTIAKEITGFGETQGGAT